MRKLIITVTKTKYNSENNTTTEAIRLAWLLRYYELNVYLSVFLLKVHWTLIFSFRGYGGYSTFQYSCLTAADICRLSY